MKMLIIYASKSGTSEECATTLVSKFQNLDVDVVNIAKKAPSIDSYDIVIMGAGVRAGRIPKNLFKFMMQNEGTLLTKKVAFFLCCAAPEQFNTYIENNVPKALNTASIAFGNFGGSLDLSRFHGFEKFIVRIIRNSIKNKEESDDESENRAMPAVIPENIERFADDIKKVYKQ